MENEVLAQFSGLKIFKHLDRLEKLKKNEKFYPISVDLSPTNICNHSCIWCCYGSALEGHKESLSRDEMLRIVNELASLGIKGINFTGGGEPLLNKHTVEAMEKASSLGIDIGLITNGDLLNEDAINRLIKICLYIRVSLDAGTKSVYSKIHNVKEDIFEKIIANIRNLVNAKRKSGSRCSIGVQFLVHKENKGEIYSVAKKLKDIGIDFFQIRPAVQAVGAKKESRILKEANIPGKVKELSDDKFKVIVIEHKFKEETDPRKKDYAKCLFHYFSTTIGADGEVYLCCHFIGNKKYSFGNIRDKSFKDIWDSDKRKEIINKLNFAECEASCKGDRINRLLYQIEKIPHSNIL